MSNIYSKLSTGYAIKCWECRSDGDPKCADPFDNTSFPITDCLTKAEKEHLPGLKATMCRKIRQKGSLVGLKFDSYHISIPLSTFSERRMEILPILCFSGRARSGQR